MRRPLFDSGLPQVVPVDASGTTILDLRDLSTELQSFTRFVTVYAAGRSLSSQLAVYFQEGEETPIPINAVAQLNAQMSDGPVKVLDRFPLRGDARLFVTADRTPAVWGYFELDGSTNIDVTTRPLQAGSLVSPFTYVPSAIGEAEPDQVLHTLVTGYYDIITIDAWSAEGEGLGAEISVSDGVDSVSLPLSLGTELIRIFDGIPMMALSTSVDPAITLSVGNTTAAVAFGSFSRVS